MEFAPASAALVRDWTLCALVAATARFVPVPLLDDVIKGRANRLAVGRTLTAEGRTFPVKWVAPLYDTGSWLGALLSLPLAVVLYPIRKIVAVISAVKGVPTDFLETFLLARAVHRHLQREGFQQPTELEGRGARAARKKLKKEADAFREAFDEAFDGMNLKVLSAAFGEGLEQLKDLGALATELTSKVLSRDEPEDQPADDEGSDEDDEVGAPLEPMPNLEGLEAAGADEAARKIEEALGKSEVVEAFADFDRRLDDAWAKR